MLGKKCFVLCIVFWLVWDEGWLVEYMLILGIISFVGKKCYVVVVFFSVCGKINLVMMWFVLLGWKVECVGDDIVWMRFDSEG